MHQINLNGRIIGSNNFNKIRKIAKRNGIGTITQTITNYRGSGTTKNIIHSL